MANIFGSSRTSLRAEYRYINYKSHDLRLDDQLLSIGLQFGFGKKAAPLAAPAAEPPPPPPPPPPAPVPDPDSDNDGVIDRQDKCPNTRAGVEVDVNGCEIMAEIQLQGVHFESNSDRLVSGAQVVLDETAATLVKNPGIKVEVAGYTDSVGDELYNESLSAGRAATVRDYLASRGVPMERMTARGYGESQPIADNNTMEGKAANRRVVLRITSR
jgi:OOP family OmpA-OmpF porin